MIDKSAIIKTAQKLTSKGQIDKAIAEWEKLLVTGKDGNIHNTIGDLYLKKNSESAAIESFTKAAEIFKSDGFYPKAIALYKKILNILPNDPNALIALAKLNADKGLVANAIENYFKAAEIYHRDGSTEIATSIADQILKLSASDLEIRKKIAYLYFRLGLRVRAADEYALIASTFLENNEYEKAEEMYNQSIEFDPENTMSLSGLSKLAENTNNMEKAFEYLEKAISLEPENIALILSHSTLLMNNDRTNEAKDSLIKLSETHPSDLNLKKMLGTIYLKDDKTEQAWEQLLPCIDGAMETEEWSSAHELLHNFKAIFPIPVKQRMLKICRAQGDEDTIRNEMKELAVLYEHDHIYDDALNLYKEALESAPDDNSALNKIQELEIKLGIPKPVEYAAQPEPVLSEGSPIQQTAILEEAAPQPEIHHDDTVESPFTEPYTPNIASREAASAPAENLAEKKAEADFFTNQGLNSEALAIYEEIISFDPDNEEIRNKIELLKPSFTEMNQSPAEEEVFVGDTDQQEDVTAADTSTIDDDLKDIFSDVGNDEKEDYEFRYQKGLEYRRQGLLDEAVKELRIASQDPDKKIRNSTMLAMCYKEKQCYPEAIIEFSKVMESMSPSDSTYLHVKYELATAHLNNTDPDKALKLYTEIHSQEPDFKDVSDKIDSIQPQTQESKPKSKRDRVSYI